MVIDPKAQAVVEGYFASMRARAAGENGMAALFAEDAVYIEPFSSGSAGSQEQRRHIGKIAIVEFFGQAWSHQPADMTVSLDRLDIDGDLLRSEWTCASAVFTTPMRGYDLFTIQNGKIVRLETMLLHPEIKDK